MSIRTKLFPFVLLLLGFQGLMAQSLTAPIPDAPLVKEGKGPYSQLIIRGVTLINGTGSPPLGPVDIVVENNRITRIIPLTE